jgi:sporulation protein YlmC with PRC-barrel domain
VLLLSELVGCRVRDWAGDEVGRLRDLAVNLAEPYPLVTRLRFGRRRSDRLVKWELVSGVRPDAIQLRQAVEPSANESLAGDEVWLAEHVLDTQVIDVAGRRLIRVGDVALEQDEAALRLAGVEIGAAAVLRRLGLRRLARRAGSELVDWRDLHPTSGRAHALQLQTTASRVHRLTAAELDAVVARLPPHRAAEVLEAVEPVAGEKAARPPARRRRYHRVLSARHRAPS